MLERCWPEVVFITHYDGSWGVWALDATDPFDVLWRGPDEGDAWFQTEAEAVAWVTATGYVHEPHTRSGWKLARDRKEAQQ